MIMGAPQMGKRELRTMSKSLRKQAFNKYGIDASVLISQHFKEWFQERKNIETIAFYYPIGSEIDPFPLVNALVGFSIRFCLPVVVGAQSPLIFKEWNRNSKLMDSSYGTKVPAQGQTLIPDLILTPLLAFDHAGSRLGYGGGFYDRTIELLKRDTNIFVLGLAFECQRTDVIIPIEPTDQKIDCVLTEKGFQFFTIS